MPHYNKKGSYVNNKSSSGSHKTGSSVGSKAVNKYMKRYKDVGKGNPHKMKY